MYNILQGNYSMNMRIEKIPAMPIEFKNIILIKDPFTLAIYVFLLMQTELGEYTVPVIIDKMVEHFSVTEKKVLKAFKTIIDELELVSMTKSLEK